MLRAILTKQPHDKQRLWFSDQNHDLFIWLNENAQPVAFQFSYDKNINENSINMSLENGFSHDRVDNGESGDVSYKMTPIMIPYGEFDCHKIASKFKSISKQLDPAVTDFIYHTLLE